MLVDLRENKKQEEFYNIAIESALGLNTYRHLWYGGAIRGGKTFVSLAIFLTYCKMFPGSKWHVFRADFPVLQSTTIPSMVKIVGNNPNYGWNRQPANYFLYHKKNDSKIFFKSENISGDPELNDLLGLETNGIFYEQIEELSTKLYEMGNSRLGSWYIPKMPKPITLATLNPTQKWPKEQVYDKYVENMLPDNYFFQPALPKDNPYVTADQWDIWNRLEERYKMQFIDGVWDDLTDDENRWAYAYSSDKHDGMPELNRNEPVYISCDFNRNPMCWSIIQWYNDTIYVLETIKIPNTGTDAMCEYVKVYYPECLYIVTGDSSGNSRSHMFEEEITNYKIIKSKLRLTTQQIKVVPNPPLEKNATLVNSILANYKVVVHKERAKALIYDFKHVKKTPDGKILKLDRTDPKQQADSLDTFRYWCNRFMSWYLKGII